MSFEQIKKMVSFFALLIALLILVLFFSSITVTSVSVPVPPVPALTEGGTNADFQTNIDSYPTNLYPAVNLSYDAGTSVGTSFLIKKTATYPIPSNFTFLSNWSFTSSAPNITISTTTNANDTATCTEGAYQVFGNVPIEQGQRIIFSVLLVTSCAATLGTTTEGVGVGTVLDNKAEILGNAESVGFFDNGFLVLLGGGYDLGFTPLGGNNKLIDVAVDTVSTKMWFRVDGGDWQG